MRPQAPSASTSLSFLGLVLTLCLAGCGQGVWPDRQPTIVEDIRVDGVSFVPAKSRFVLRDSTTKVLFKGYHPGYLCSEVLDLGLDPVASSSPLAFGPKTRIRLPADADCPLDSSGRDTLITKVFGAGNDSIIRLINSTGSLTDSARLVRGRFSNDSLTGVPAGIVHTFSRGRWTYLDSTSQLPRRLFADSLTVCEYLNRATYSRQDSIVKVQISLVTLDPAFAPDSCHGIAHQQELVLDLLDP